MLLLLLLGQTGGKRLFVARHVDLATGRSSDGADGLRWRRLRCADRAVFGCDYWDDKHGYASKIIEVDISVKESAALALRICTDINMSASILKFEDDRMNCVPLPGLTTAPVE